MSERGNEEERRTPEETGHRGGERAETPEPGSERGGRQDPSHPTDPEHDAGRYRAVGPLTEQYLRQERRQHQEDLGTSWGSVVVGWFAALGAGLVLSGIVAAVVGGVFAALGTAGIQEGGISGLVGFALTLFLAFLIGGYAAGRMASRSGLKHGLLVPLLNLILAALLAGAATVLGAGLLRQTGLALPSLPGLPADVARNPGAVLTISGLVALLLPFLGGALGGRWGAKTGTRRGAP